MARPSKKTKELRTKIHELNIFKRDNEIYTNFELKCEGSNKYYTPYLFCEEAHTRIITDLYFIIIGQCYQEFTRTAEIDKLYKINKNLAIYCLRLKIQNVDLFHLKKDKTKFNYLLDILVDTDIIEKATGKNMKDYDENGMCSLSDVELELTDEIKQKIEKEINLASKIFHSYSPYRIKIKHKKIDPRIFNYLKPYNRTAEVEIDFTKPKEEILAYVEQLKDDYDNGLLSIKTPEEILTDKVKDDFKCDLKNCVIHKDTRSPKPIHGRLADVLFIYDCKKVNEILGADILTKDYITDEINRYWQKVKNFFTDNFYSLDEYYEIAKEYIDDKRYKDYLSGIKTTPLK